MKKRVTIKRSHSTKQIGKTAPALAVPLRTALFGGAALLILFAWLHLFLALQIASTGQQIQLATEELQKLKRDNMAVVRDTAVAESEENMTRRATELGYGPQAPVYLSLGQTLGTTGQAIDGSGAEASASLAGGDSQGRALSQFLLDTTLYEVTTAEREASGSEASSAEREP